MEWMGNTCQRSYNIQNYQMNKKINIKLNMEPTIYNTYMFLLNIWNCQMNKKHYIIN